MRLRGRIQSVLQLLPYVSNLPRPTKKFLVRSLLTVFRLIRPPNTKHAADSALYRRLHVAHTKTRAHRHQRRNYPANDVRQRPLSWAEGGSIHFLCSITADVRSFPFDTRPTYAKTSKLRWLTKNNVEEAKPCG